MVTFAHLADCHLGAWRDPKMQSLGLQAFEDAIGMCISKNVDFVIIAGDLFNTALPGIDVVKHAVRVLGLLKRAGISCYFIAGSHDYSPTGKTMLDVLAEAHLAIDVCKLSVNEDEVSLSVQLHAPTGTQLCGVLGKAGQLDRLLYEHLVISDEIDPVNSVFVFHTAIEELKPPGKDIGSTHPISFLPPGFGYYAGGHVHTINEVSLDGYKRVVYPGPLFPASFSELEEFRHGGFCIVTLGEQVTVERVSLPVAPTIALSMDVTDKDPDHVTESLIKELKSRDVSDAIVLVRLTGTLVRGGSADINFRSVFDDCRRQGALVCMKNTVAVRSPQLEVIEAVADTPEDIEHVLIREFAGSVDLPGVKKSDQEALIAQLVKSLAQSAGEETKKAYEKRVLDRASTLLGVALD